MRLGILTGGGDCPGLNAAIRAVVRAGDQRGVTVLGFRDGWRGVLDGEAHQLSIEDVRGILPRGGTILGTSGTQPSLVEGGPDLVRDAIGVHGLDGFIVIGGEGTMGTIGRHAGRSRSIGIPKTIDNDIGGTDASIGFWTAAQIATDSIDRLYSTAESHNRVMVCEVMGRTAGWIGITSGHRGRSRRDLDPGAPVRHRSRLPAHPADPFGTEAVLDRRGLRRGHAGAPARWSCPEYALDDNGWPRLGGIGAHVADEIQTRTRSETQGDDARPRAAGRLAGRVRPGARVTARRRGRRSGDRRPLGEPRRGARGGHRDHTARRDRRPRQRRFRRNASRIPEILCR